VNLGDWRLGGKTKLRKVITIKISLKKGKASKQMCYHICSLRFLNLVLEKQLTCKDGVKFHHQSPSKKECPRIEKLPVKLSWPCFT
jgi:hypothetical protein